MRRVYSWSTGWPAALALAVFWWVLATTAVAGKSPAFDEPNHLAGGYSYWTRSDYRLHPENGVLPQRWFALPLALSKPIAFPSERDPRWIGAHEWAVSRAVLQELGNDGPALLGRARRFAACFGLALLLLVYAWARRLFGRGGGMLALLAGTFDPTLLANGPLLTSDTAMALALLAAATMLWSVLHRITLWRLLGSVLALGGLFLTKFSAPIIVLIAAVLVAVRLVVRAPLAFALGRWQGEARSRWRQLGIVGGLVLLHAVAVWALIWGAYGFRYSATEPGATGGFMIPWDKVASKPSIVQGVVAFGREHRLLPEAYLYGLAFVDAHTVVRPAFMNGRVYKGGRASFFPFAFAIKTPLGLLALVALGIAGAAYRRRARGPAPPGAEASVSLLYEATPLIVVFVLYWLFAMSTGLNIGLRHLLPTYPMLYIAAGGAVGWIATRSRAASVVTALALAALVSASVAARPHYLAFFNPTVGQKNAYRYLVDSSLDWGQDLYGVGRWIRAQGRDQRVYLAYFGNLDPRGAGIQAKLLPGFFDFRSRSWRPPEVFRLEPGIYCISATMLSGVYSPETRPWTAKAERSFRRYGRMLAASLVATRQPTDLSTLRAYLAFDKLRFGRLVATLRRREPDAQVGHSVLIYRVGAAELKRALQGPVPAPLCCVVRREAKSEVAGALLGLERRIGERERSEATRGRRGGDTVAAARGLEKPP